MEKKIAVIVSGGMVTSILGCGDLSDVAIEVFDLDRPAFESPEEEAMFDNLENQVEEMERSSEWSSLF